MALALAFEEGPTVEEIGKGDVEMGLIFELTHEQAREAENWMNDHDCGLTKFMKETGCTPALGERVRFIFIPTLLGTVAFIECNCGARLLLTNLEDL